MILSVRLLLYVRIALPLGIAYNIAHAIKLHPNSMLGSNKKAEWLMT